MEQFKLSDCEFNEYFCNEFDLELLENSAKSLRQLFLVKYDLHWEILKEFLSTCSKLEYFSLKDSPNVQREFDLICNGLKRSANSLKGINFTGCRLNHKHVKNLFDLLRVCSSLKFIELGYFPKFLINIIKKVENLPPNIKDKLKFTSF